MRTGNLYRTYKLLEEIDKILGEFPIKSDDFYRIMPLFAINKKAKNQTFVGNYIVSNFNNIKDFTCREKGYTFKVKDKEYYTVRKSKPMGPRKMVSIASEFWSTIGFEEREDISIRNIVIKELISLGISPFSMLPFVKIPMHKESKKKIFVPKNFFRDDFEYILR